VPAVELGAGTNLIVYAAGSLDDGTLTFYTQTIRGLGGSPTAVNTGDTDIASGTPPAVVALAVAAGVFGLTGAGLLANRRRVR
jgi:hypothetical protein